MDILWLDRAVRELQSVYDYIAAENPAAALKVMQRIGQAAASLGNTPNIGRPGRVAGTRELVVAGTPFIVPYRVRNGVIEILAVIHAARKWPDSL